MKYLRVKGMTIGAVVALAIAGVGMFPFGASAALPQVTGTSTPTSVPTGVATDTPKPAPTATNTPAPSSGGGTTTSNTTTTQGNLSVSTTASASGAVAVVGTAGANTGVADLPTNVNIGAIVSGPLTTGATPPVDPAAITGTAPSPITATVNAATGGVILAGNAAIVVPQGALAGVAGGVATFAIAPATNVPTPGGPAQFSPNGSLFSINITDSAGAPVTTFPVAIPIEIKYNGADLGQANGNASILTGAYIVDALTPGIANPNHFPAGTFVLFPSEHVSLSTQTGTLLITTQAIGSTVAVVTNPVGYVQTLQPSTPELSSFDPGQSQTFGSKPQFSYLQVVEPQIGNRLLVVDPDTGNYSYVNATDVGPSGAPPAKSSAAVVRGIRGKS